VLLRGFISGEITKFSEYEYKLLEVHHNVREWSVLNREAFFFFLRIFEICIGISSQYYLLLDSL
jgi:hypothetical protein